MRRFPVLLGLALLLALSACGSPRVASDMRAPLECVPFARALSGIDLAGDAPDWWWESDGEYARGRTPEVGSVMAFAASSQLSHGHLSVVSKVVSRREILVTHANWVRHHVT